MELTQEERQFLLELLGKLQFGINGIEQAQFARNLALKLQVKEIEEEVKEEKKAA